MVPSPNQSNVDGCTSGTFSHGVDNNNNSKRVGGGWLSGLGLHSGSSNSMRSHVPSSRRTSGLSISSPRQRAATAIANDIRNDRELFFADDEPIISVPPSQTTPACQMGHMMLSSGYNAQHNSPSHQIIEPRRQHTTNSSRRLSVMSSRSSQQKLENLQREVDMALEFFHQETEAELDEDFDGDDYLLNRHTATNNEKKFSYQPVGGKKEPPHCDTRRSCGSGSDECCDGEDSFPGTAATSMATSVTTYADSDNVEFDDCQFNKYLSLPEDTTSSPYDSTTTTRHNSSSSEPSTPKISGSSATGLSLKKHKTKSIIQLPLSLIPSQTAMNCTFDDTGDIMDVDDESIKFENVIANVIAEEVSVDERRHRSVDFNKGNIRNALEPFLAVARLRREDARQEVFDTLDKVALPQGPTSRRASASSDIGFHIGSTYGVPYPALRNEQSFLYDTDSYPLAQILAETLGVEDLSKIHLECPLKKDKGRLLATLQNRGKRRKFHQCFDSFVVSQVIPLLHSQGLSKGVFYTNRHQLRQGKPQSIIYRYQAFPSINIVRPGESSTDPHCDMSQGHSIGSISYHIPLTQTFGTNALYLESRPGREDWHPLVTKSPGLGFQFDGARCLHFNLKNETDITRVSLNFRIAITRAPDCNDIAYDPDDQLCCPELLKDKFSGVENFYDAVEVNMGEVPRSFCPGPVATKYRSKGGISVVG